MTNDDIDEFLGLSAPPGPAATSRPEPPAEVEPQGPNAGPKLQRWPGARPATSPLIPYKGGAFTKEEIEAIRAVEDKLLSEGGLPCEYPGGDASGLPYRSAAYGPYSDDVPEGPKLYQFRRAMHKGQTKLCAIEVEAITRALNHCSGLRYVVYAGAAPGEHIAFLAEAFPGLEFHLYDPTEFRFQFKGRDFGASLPRIRAARVLFTDELARRWSSLAASVIFISDIRSGSQHQEEFEAEVWANMQMQRRWWQIMNPAAALFKFRLPYADGVRCDPCPYLDGELLLQPFAPLNSTEGRLLVWQGAGERMYDPIQYENFFFRLNVVTREWASFDHPIPLHMVPGLCYCFDCGRLVQAFRAYAASFPAASGQFANDEGYIAYLIGRMVLATGQSLDCPPHGVEPDVRPGDNRLRLCEKYSAEFAARQRKKTAGASRNQRAPPVVQVVRPPTVHEASTPAPVPVAAPIAALVAAPVTASVTAPKTKNSLPPLSLSLAPFSRVTRAQNKK